jgi:hypothetical protein
MNKHLRKPTIEELLNDKKELTESIRKFEGQIRKWDMFRLEAKRKLDNINEILQKLEEKLPEDYKKEM